MGGFPDRSLIVSVIKKVGLDVEACAHELVSLSEWDVMLSDLEEMGFNDRERNKELLVENSGSITKTEPSVDTRRGSLRRPRLPVPFPPSPVALLAAHIWMMAVSGVRLYTQNHTSRHSRCCSRPAYICI